MIKIVFFFAAIMSVFLAVCEGAPSEVRSKPFGVIREEFGEGIRNVTKTAGQSVTNSIDALIRAFLTVSQVKIDLIKTVVDKQATAVENFIDRKIEKIDSIRSRFRNMILKRLETTEEPANEQAQVENVIQEGLSELDNIKKEMQEYLDKMKNKKGIE